jgi:hypothetical protein
MGVVVIPRFLSYLPAGRFLGIHNGFPTPPPISWKIRSSLWCTEREMISKGLRSVAFLSGILLLFSGIPGLRAQSSTLISGSPDGKWMIKRVKADPGDRGEARKSLEICTAGGRVLYSWLSGLGATTVLWSPDSRHVAVNDMPGDGGDLLRIFAIDAKKPAVTPLREPDGKKLRSEVESRKGSFLSTIDRVSLRALEWRDGDLWCRLGGTFRPKRQPTLSVPFHHLWVFAPDGINPPVLKEEWAQTFPREKPFRDEEK